MSDASTTRPGFQLHALDPDTIDLSSARKVVVDESPGFPCRVSLQDAAIGETVYALSYPHHDVGSPYRSSGPIFIRRGAEQAMPAPGEIPLMFAHRQLSLRAYDAEAMMISAEVVGPGELRTAIERQFAAEDVSYLHVHNARPGCFNCAVTRA
jgi:hypothetical protein